MAEYALLSEAQVGLKPVSLKGAVAGTIPLVGLTALELLQKTGAPWHKANLTVVVTSGSGGTGFMGVQLAKAFGAAYVATAAGNAESIAFVKSIGADLVIDYHTQVAWRPASSYDRYSDPASCPPVEKS